MRMGVGRPAEFPTGEGDPPLVQRLLFAAAMCRILSTALFALLFAACGPGLARLGDPVHGPPVDGGAGATDAGGTGADAGCVPACAGKACGPDGCAGNCGTCAASDDCNAAGACVPRSPCGSRGPNAAEECGMFALVNQDRAQKAGEAPGEECATPLAWNESFAVRARDHSQKMADQGGLFHADFDSGQNVEMIPDGWSMAQGEDLFMNSAGEGPCPAYSHHCNIMRCWPGGEIGIGLVHQGGYVWLTQDF